MKRLMWAAAVAAVMGMGQALALPAAADPWVTVAAEAGLQDKGTKGAKETKVRFSTVMVNGREVLRLAETKDLHADERADTVQERLMMVIAPDPGEAFKPVLASDVTVESVDGAVVVRLRNQNVAQVTPEDARLVNTTTQALGQKWAEDLRGALEDLKLAKGQPLPANLVTVAKGEMTMPGREAGTAPKGGGAGTAPKEPKK